VHQKDLEALEAMKLSSTVLTEVHTPFSRFVDSVKICCAVTSQSLPGFDRNVG